MACGGIGPYYSADRKRNQEKNDEIKRLKEENGRLHRENVTLKLENQALNRENTELQKGYVRGNELVYRFRKREWTKPYPITHAFNTVEVGPSLVSPTNQSPEEAL